MRPLGGDDDLGFVHALVRDAVYAGITKAERVELHERAARHLDRAENPNDAAAAVHLEAAAPCSRRGAAPSRRSSSRRGTGSAPQASSNGAASTRLVPQTSGRRSRAIFEPDDPYRLDVGVELGLALRDVGEPTARRPCWRSPRRAARRLRRRRLELRVEVESIGLAASSGDGDAVAADTAPTGALPVFRRTRDDRFSAGPCSSARSWPASAATSPRPRLRPRRRSCTSSGRATRRPPRCS